MDITMAFRGIPRSQQSKVFAYMERIVGCATKMIDSWKSTQWYIPQFKHFLFLSVWRPDNCCAPSYHIALIRDLIRIATMRLPILQILSTAAFLHTALCLPTFFGKRDTKSLLLRRDCPNKIQTAVTLHYEDEKEAPEKIVVQSIGKECAETSCKLYLHDWMSICW